MFRVIISVVIIFLANYSLGYKWVSMKFGDKIPPDAIAIGTIVNSDQNSNTNKNYVGRTRHFDEILLAEVNDNFTLVENCGKQLIKNQYEILVGDNCSWEPCMSFEDIPWDIVRGGTLADGEPIFIGKYYNSETKSQLKPIYFSSEGRDIDWNNWNVFVLRCDTVDIWVDTSAKNVPNNTVSGGKSIYGNEIFVARLKTFCSIIPGQVIPHLGFATAIYNNEAVQSPFCQVLTGSSDKYSWIMTGNGDIPEYAVIGSRDRYGEFLYVSRENKTLGYMKHSMSTKEKSYEILVKNDV